MNTENQKVRSTSHNEHEFGYIVECISNHQWKNQVIARLTDTLPAIHEIHFLSKNQNVNIKSKVKHSIRFSTK